MPVHNIEVNSYFGNPIVSKWSKKHNRLLVQQKPLNVITSDHAKRDNINRMITLNDFFY